MLLGCTGEIKNPIEGSWDLIYFRWTYPDSSFLEYPGNVKTCTYKWMLTDNNSLWYYRYQADADSSYISDIGDMEYKFDGKSYQETYMAAQDEKYIGQTFHYNVTIKNDTLTLSGPDKGEIERLGCSVFEIFVRK